MNSKEFFVSHRRFYTDYDRLKRWYFATLLSYETSINETKKIVSDKAPSKREKVYFKEEEYGTKHLIQHDHRDMLRKYQNGYITFLDEMVTIRLVSLLEVLLSENIEHCFYYDKRIFFTKGKYQTNISEFLYKSKEELEEDFIGGIVDKISRGGLTELKKAYLSKLKIDLNSFQVTDNSRNFTYKDIQKLHDTRHLIIHQLGKTDVKYRTQYNYPKKNIKLTTEDILYYLDLVHFFADFVKKELERKIIKES